MKRAGTKKRWNAESHLQEGENPKGFTAQTPNGTAHAFGTGWNKDYCGTWTQAQLEPDPTRPEGRSNRTGE
jgi:hypothetical protein